MAGLLSGNVPEPTGHEFCRQCRLTAPSARPAVPASSAFGSKQTHTRPTSRGRVCCVSFRLGRWWEQTAAGSGAGACRLRRFLGVRVDGAFMMRHNVRRFCGIVIFAEERGFRPFLSLAHVYSDAEGKIGRRGNDAALPRRGKGRCRCAYSTLFAPAGQKRFRAGAPDFGRVAGKGG